MSDVDTGAGSKKGRLTMTIHPLSYFTGVDAVAPKTEELSYHDDTFDLIMFYQDAQGNWFQKSRTKEIQEYLDTLANSGVFTSAAAFVNNRKIYRFYFDTANAVVRLDPELRFDQLYRYYAIRQVSLTSSGAKQYITGVAGSSSEGVTTVSNLVNMDLEDSESGDGTKVSVPQLGGLVAALTDGQSYVVEFFNSDRQLVNLLTFQAISAYTTDLDLSPDTAVTDMYVQTNQVYESAENACYLYRGQDINELEIATKLKFADGRTRSVSHEQTTGGRLVISGLDEISTDTVTPTGGTPQKFQVTYELIRSNASIGSSSSTTSTGAILNPASLTITKTISVYIIEDVFNDLVSFIPVGYVTLVSAGNYKISLKFFGHYSNGAVHDITNIVSYTNSNSLVDNSFGVTQQLSVKVPYGNAGLYHNYSFTVFAPTPTPTSAKRVIINGVDCRYIVANQSETGGGIYSGKFTGFRVYNEINAAMESLDYAALLALPGVTFDNKVPTHVRIRDVIDPTFIYTGIVDGSGGIYFTSSGSGHDIFKDRVLLIEFFYITVDQQGNATSVFTTGALAHYVTISNA